MPDQRQIPFTGWPSAGRLRAIGYLTALANSGGNRQLWGRGWYAVKDRVLRRWGRRDGWDLQVFECWGELGRVGRDEGVGCEGVPCVRCGGTGVHRAVELKRYRIGRALLHQPGRAISSSRAAVLVEDAGGWHRKITDRIRHHRRRGADLAFKLLMLALGLRPPARPRFRLPRRSARWLATMARAAWAWWARGHWVIRPGCYRLPIEIGFDERCPMCLGRLGFEVNARHDGTAATDVGGVNVFCLSCWGGHSDWYPVVARVERWIAKRCRVFDCALADESDCTPYSDDIPF